MNQRTVVITLALICLMAVVGLVGLRGWTGPEKVSNPPGCFDIEVNPITAKHTFLVNKCTGETWQVQIGFDNDLVWVPLERYPTALLDVKKGLGDE